VLHAVRAAERSTGLAVWQFRLIPDVDAARYDLLIEPPRPLGNPNGLADFITAIDRALAEVNMEYACKRASGRLAPPRLCLMRPGWSERLCSQEFAGGRREIQHKWSAIRLQWDDASRSEVVCQVDGLARSQVRS
jgi:hypothetical protein